MAEEFTTPVGLNNNGQLWNLAVDNDGNLVFNSNSLTAGTARMVLHDDNGNVGIGTTNPTAGLHINETTGAQGISSTLKLQNGNNTAGSGTKIQFAAGSGPSIPSGRTIAEIHGIRTSANDNNGALAFYTSDDDELGEKVRISHDGDVGLGTNLPRSPLHIYSPANPTTLRIQSSRGFGAGRVEFWSDPQGATNEWRPGFIQSTDEGGFTGGLAFFVNGSGFSNKTAAVEVMRITNGNVHVNGDIILNNADCAEEFSVADPATAEPGTVMVLGDNSLLKPSQKSYDKRVVGVISGAGSYKPGIILDRQDDEANRCAVALVGKVFCKVTTINGAIETGDLLTTSDIPGHAMKATDPLQAFGAVIGKALSDLKSGEGLIPVLIALQ